MKKFLLVVLSAFFILSCGSETNTSTQTSNENQATQEATATEKEPSGLGDGTYMVGEDIQAGMYKVILSENAMGMGYVERAKDVNMEVDSIIANIALTGNGYVEIKETDKAVRIQGAELFPVKLEELQKDIKTEMTDGIYLVGYDLEPGTYKVELTENAMGMGYVERAKSVAMGIEDIIANEALQGNGYVKIEKGDFAVKLQGVKITKK